jgi:hypothetical protein
MFLLYLLQEAEVEEEAMEGFLLIIIAVALAEMVDLVDMPQYFIIL